jgi:hypothetical protein
MSDDTITLEMSGSEAHALEAALTLYRSLLASGLELGGDAREASLLMDPPARRAQTRLADLMYGPEDLSAGDFYAWPLVGEVAS